MSAIANTGLMPATSSSRILRDASPAGRTLLVGIALQTALLLPCLIAYGIDGRTLSDISVWSKPIKFQLSLIVLMATMVWLLPLIAATARHGRAAAWTSLAIVLSSTLEIAYITVQAARGRASHFNIETPVEALGYQIMGIGAVILVSSCFILGLLIWRRGAADAPSGLRHGAAIGLMLGAVLTLITAGVLGSGQLAANSHWIGGIRSDANGLFLLGWSRSGGDLRVPHFFATHIIQGLPLLGLLLDRFAPGFIRSGLWAGAAVSVGVVAGTFMQAVSGLPFL
jgi:hypothetical protein